MSGGRVCDAHLLDDASTHVTILFVLEAWEERRKDVSKADGNPCE